MESGELRPFFRGAILNGVKYQLFIDCAQMYSRIPEIARNAAVFLLKVHPAAFWP